MARGGRGFSPSKILSVAPDQLIHLSPTDYIDIVINISCKYFDKEFDIWKIHYGTLFPPARNPPTGGAPCK